ncbi:unnamed protein product [Prunus armeniaca]|uniref:Uncharacterized protein n=1 Tax=Prunus armeniaca TaxID=36596 RepID=A0A6J5YD66_PRUAR|nr:unnamed protein product [Prunus armeniaca]CAB4321785.1 unnamed protein product [Prunus armeniaca]
MMNDPCRIAYEIASDASSKLLISMKNNLLRQNAPWHTSAAVVLFNIRSQAWSCNLHQPYSSNLGTHFV